MPFCPKCARYPKKAAIRQFIAEYNQRHGATVILTSHYMADVTALTRRVIVISQGHLLYDGDLGRLVEQVAPYKLLSLVLCEPAAIERLAQYGQIETVDGIKATLRVPRHRATEVAARLLTDIELDDVLIEEPPVEDIIRQQLKAVAAPPQEKSSRQVKSIVRLS